MKKTASKSSGIRQIGLGDPLDRLIDFRQVNSLTGSKCKTSHNARALAERGQIKAVRLNERTIRYSEQSVIDLVAGRAPVVATNQLEGRL